MDPSRGHRDPYDISGAIAFFIIINLRKTLVRASTTPEQRRSPRFPWVTLLYN